MNAPASSSVAELAQPASVASQIGRKWIAAAVLLAAGILFIAQVSAAPNKDFKDGAAVLTMVSLVAVGIERIIEMFWTLVASFKSAWWPLSAIADAVDSVVGDTNNAVQPVFTKAITGLQGVRATMEAANEDLTAIDAEIQKVRDQKTEYDNQIKRIQSLGKDGQRVQLVATTAFQAVNRIDTAYGAKMRDVRKAVNDANQVATGVSDLLATLKDNPAKKLLSIYLGSMIGLVVAGLLGLDLFAAAGASLTVGGWKLGSGDNPFVLLPHVGVAITGIVVGFGANPTHQIVNYVTEVAKARKAGNQADPQVVDGTDTPPQSTSDRFMIARARLGSTVRLRVAGEGDERYVDIAGEHLDSLLDNESFSSEPPDRLVRPASMSIQRRR